MCFWIKTLFLARANGELDPIKRIFRKFESVGRVIGVNKVYVNPDPLTFARDTLLIKRWAR